MRLAIDLHVEVGGGQSGNRTPILVEHGDRELDDVDAALEARNLLLRCRSDRRDRQDERSDPTHVAASYLVKDYPRLVASRTPAAPPNRDGQNITTDVIF